jgi:hypothetical protein
MLYGELSNTAVRQYIASRVLISERLFSFGYSQPLPAGFARRDWSAIRATPFDTKAIGVSAGLNRRLANQQSSTAAAPTPAV